MAEPKTKQNAASAADFLAAIEDKKQRADAKKIASLMCAAPSSRGKMWRDSIVGFGSYHCRRVGEIHAEEIRNQEVMP